MSTVERKEYKETKVLRTLSPVRNAHGSNQNLTEFDSNLDYLLEDLQNSVSRPGSSLGQSSTNTYRETSRNVNTLDSTRSNSLNRITGSKAPVTEYSSDDAYNYTSPDGRQHVTGYKKEKFMYKTSSSGDVFPEKSRMQSSINQLDTLLDDLQQVKKSSYSDRESYNVSGLDPGFHGPSTTKTVNRELHYGDTPRATSRSRTLERTEGSLSRREYSSEGTYGDLRSIRPVSPSPSSRTSTLSKQAKVTNIHEYPVEVRETVVPDIDPEVLAHLDPNLRPPGNTKVTTTIKTYTYEIPGSGDFPTNLSTSKTVDSEKYVYSPNQTDQSITTPSKSFVYNKIENKENTYEENTSYPLYKKPTPPGGVLVKETITTRNYQPGYSPELNPPNQQQTYVYNETTSTKNVNQNGYPPEPQDSYLPPGKTTYIINETKTVDKTNTTPFSERGYPVYNPPEARNTTYVSKETHNRTFQNGYPPNEPPGKTIIYKHETHTHNNAYGPDGEPLSKPKEPINIRYTYKSTNTTQNSYKGGYPPNSETETLLPHKFPVNEGVDGPPKKLDELMANIGHEPPNSALNAGFTAHEQELAHQKKVDTLKRQAEEADDMQKKEPVAKTKNVAGPPVYYPPGHEMFAKKEESEAAWRAQGGYAKASGKYQYEAESKSKSKSSGGAAVVPICLPLCCGLPCTLL